MGGGDALLVDGDVNSDTVQQRAPTVGRLLVPVAGKSDETFLRSVLGVGFIGQASEQEAHKSIALLAQEAVEPVLRCTGLRRQAKERFDRELAHELASLRSEEHKYELQTLKR